jgi:hypothetical protein
MSVLVVPRLARQSKETITQTRETAIKVVMAMSLKRQRRRKQKQQPHSLLLGVRLLPAPAILQRKAPVIPPRKAPVSLLQPSPVILLPPDPAAHTPVHVLKPKRPLRALSPFKSLRRMDRAPPPQLPLPYVYPVPRQIEYAFTNVSATRKHVQPYKAVKLQTKYLPSLLRRKTLL